jgi:hypothetical protein
MSTTRGSRRINYPLQRKHIKIKETGSPERALSQEHGSPQNSGEFLAMTAGHCEKEE